MADWQDISTAPKDGALILAFMISEVGDEPHMGTVRWDGGDWSWRPLYCHPTHWMPLPDPPEEG